MNVDMNLLGLWLLVLRLFVKLEELILFDLYQSLPTMVGGFG
tara:strand:+ start:1077 stop:1202 length:126 start_codon:yes stop_codon:yes gene_type:complete